MTVVTKTQLENASLDCESLGIVINGDEDAIAVTRTGRQIKSLSNIVYNQQVQETNAWEAATVAQSAVEVALGANHYYISVIAAEADSDLEEGDIYVTGGAQDTLIYYRRTSVGSVKVAETVTAATVGNIVKQYKGKVWTSSTQPDVNFSNIGDVWFAPDGVIYERNSAQGITIGGRVLLVKNAAPIIPWDHADSQPIKRLYDALALEGIPVA
jgi:hypothetical protein